MITPKTIPYSTPTKFQDIYSIGNKTYCVRRAYTGANGIQTPQPSDHEARNLPLHHHDFIKYLK